MDYKSSIAQVAERLLDLLTGVHHEGAVGDDRLAERLPGEEHETQRKGLTRPQFVRYYLMRLGVGADYSVWPWTLNVRTG